MGFFSKIKNIFNKQEEIKEKINDKEIDNCESLNEIEEVKETEKYVEGLSKSRDNFVSKLSLLGIKHTNISDDVYDDVINFAYDLGIRNAFIQEGETQKKSFIPDFRNQEF